MLSEEQSVPAGFRQGVELTEKSDIGYRQGSKPDSDEELTEEEDVELAVNNQGKRYPLRERRAPIKFSDQERVLLTD